MLAYEETGKYVSERHAEATVEGKLTAGRMAAKLNRKFKPAEKIKAKELKQFATEWHHSGFYKGRNGSTMGRTFFFAAETDLDKLYSHVCEAREAEAKVAAEPEVERFFFSAGFKKVYGDRGRKRWQPIAKLEAVTCRPSDCFAKREEISKEDYELLQEFNGHDLESYESFMSFKTRIEAANADRKAITG